MHCNSGMFSYFGRMHGRFKQLERYVLGSLLVGPSLWAQTDPVQYQWPVPPFGVSRNINGTFCEYRNTLSANHFHDGVDIGEPDGSPVYPGLDGFVYSFSTVDGSNNYLRVRSNLGGLWKHITYIHIQPNPSLNLGDPVQAGVTVLGTIYPGMGHVHVTERELVSGDNGVRINALRSGGGLNPYVDTYTPVIDRSTLQFRQQGTGTMLSDTTLYGKVDISIRVNERNGPGSPGSTQTNNGTYMIGYRIWSADTSAVVVEPPDAGLRYRFDRMPLNTYVDVAFLGEPYSSTSAHYYFLTNGSGASAVNSTNQVLDGWLDTGPLPEGSYILEIFTEDTRGNTDRALFPIQVTKKDLVPPAIPQLQAALADSSGVRVSWLRSTDADCRGYRLSFLSTTGWRTLADESVLPLDSTSYRLTDPSLVADRTGRGLQLRVTAVDTVTPPNESSSSDVYYAHMPDWLPPNCPDGNCAAHAYLIVDGFDRFGGSGSWQFPSHDFAVRYGTSLKSEYDRVSSCSNDAILDGSVSLLAYDAVIWFLGDESTTDNTFTSAEQLKVREYLEGGGRLIVSGSEVGWDLGRTHAASEPGDATFYASYLKASFVYDGDGTMRTATGVAASPVASLTFTFGQTYPEDYPDDINPVGGASALLSYNTNRPDLTPRIAGITYTGPFGSAGSDARLAYLAFPFETMSSQLQRETLMNALLQMFGLVSDVEFTGDHAPLPQWNLSQNYPNPFNPETVLELTVPYEAHAMVRIYDLLGREVETLLNDRVKPGQYHLRWNAWNRSSGVYYARLEAGTFVQSRKLLLVR